jgi:hypothetical protein
MLAARYVAAIEKQLGWLRWTLSAGRQHLLNEGVSPEEIVSYREMLERGTTFYLEPHFCQLIDQARRTVPDDIAYEPTWVLAPAGFCVLAEPFQVPTLEKIDQILAPPFDQEVRIQTDAGLRKATIMRLRAVSWQPVTEGYVVRMHQGKHPPTFQVGAHATRFCFYLDLEDYPRDGATRHGFNAWSYFVLHAGHVLGPRIAEYEANQKVHEESSAYVYGPTSRDLHEMRWLFTALHLMSQRLATTVTYPTDRAIRRRAARQGQTAPDLIRVVTLRRLREDQVAAGVADREAPDWQWQWVVEGHWRNQYFPSTGTHARVFIEAFRKGPADKPLKPKSLTLFVGKR